MQGLDGARDPATGLPRRWCSAGKTISVEYTTEYSTDKIEMHTDAVKPGQRVLLLDDLIATGGTLGESWRRLLRARGRLRARAGGGLHCELEVSPLLLPLTNGPAVAGAELIKQAGGVPFEAACVIELPELGGRSKLGGLPLFVLVEKAGV